MRCIYALVAVIVAVVAVLLTRFLFAWAGGESVLACDLECLCASWWSRAKKTN